jgi:hypothetical protein
MITKINFLTVILLLFISCAERKTPVKTEQKITVAAYYFPNYHTGDPRNDLNMGKDWSEWELVKAAQPRFPNHQQPKVPEWGYVDEKDPVVMAKKIEAAVSHNIDCFIFDWYMYEDGPFLNRCIDEGFLKAENCDSIKFALMWANHEWVEGGYLLPDMKYGFGHLEAVKNVFGKETKEK